VARASGADEARVAARRKRQTIVRKLRFGILEFKAYRRRAVSWVTSQPLPFLLKAYRGRVPGFLLNLF
jgi:hypothetical protein